MHIFRHLAQLFLDGRQPACVRFVQSDEKSAVQYAHADLISGSLSKFSSLQLRIDIKIGTKLSPNSVKVYSTLGGTTGKTVLLIKPSFSNSRSCFVRVAYALSFMNKGYGSKDVVEQCVKLEEACIEYDVFYLTGIYGKGKSRQGVENTLKIFNQLRLAIIGASMLTVYPSSKLYQEIENGIWEKESEREKLEELRQLIEDTIKSITGRDWILSIL